MSPLVDKHDNLTPAGEAVILAITAAVSIASMGAILWGAIAFGMSRPHPNGWALVILGLGSLLAIGAGKIATTPRPQAKTDEALRDELSVARSKRRV